MERLRPHDLRALLEFLRDMYALHGLEAFPRRVITGLPKVVPSEMTTYNEVNPSKRQIYNKVIEPQGAPDFADSIRIFERHIHEHPLITHCRRTQDGRALKISDFCSASQFHRTGLYHEFFRRVEVEHQMVCTLPAPPPLVIGIALNRGRSDFSERDRLVLNLLRPHLVQAYANAEAVTRIHQEARFSEEVLEAQGEGVIVLAGDGRVRLMTSRARRRVAAYFGLAPGAADTLPEDLRRWIQHQEARLAGDGDVPPLRGPLVMEREGKRLAVRLLSEAEQHILLLEEEQVTPRPQTLEAFGLTRREAEVLAWVAAGKTNAEIGSILGTRSRTVAKHLEHIYQKLGVETRTAAAALALNRLPDA